MNIIHNYKFIIIILKKYNYIKKIKILLIIFN